MQMNSKNTDACFHMSNQDELTGALNKEALLNHLSQSVETARSNKTPLILLCANIDNMKHFNAHNGHLLGDEMLKRFVSRAAPMLDQGQLLFRYGGDWFAIVISNKTLKEVALLAEQICNDVRNNLSPAQPDNCGRENCLGPAKISVSIGMAEFEKDMTPVALLKGAEEQLNEAKCAGRDCVYFSYQKYV